MDTVIRETRPSFAFQFIVVILVLIGLGIFLYLGLARIEIAVKERDSSEYYGSRAVVRAIKADGIETRQTLTKAIDGTARAFGDGFGVLADAVKSSGNLTASKLDGVVTAQNTAITASQNGLGELVRKIEDLKGAVSQIELPSPLPAPPPVQKEIESESHDSPQSFTSAVSHNDPEGATLANTRQKNQTERVIMIPVGGSKSYSWWDLRPDRATGRLKFWIPRTEGVVMTAFYPDGRQIRSNLTDGTTDLHGANKVVFEATTIPVEIREKM